MSLKESNSALFLDLQAKYIESQKRISELEKLLDSAKKEKDSCKDNFHFLRNNLSDGIVLIDENNEIKEINLNASNIFEIRLEEDIKFGIEDVFCGELKQDIENQRFINFINQCKLNDSNEIFISDFKLTLKNNKTKHINCSFYQMLSSEKLFCVLLKDFSMMEIVQSELFASEKLFDETFEFIPLGVGIIDSDEYFLRTNTVLNKMLGFERYELNQFKISQLITLDLNFDIKEIISGKVPFYIDEIVFNNAYGESYWGRVYISPMIWENVNKIILIIQDITDVKLNELKIKRSEEKYRILFEKANDAIIVFEPINEIILEANKVALDLYGYTREEFIGMSFKNLTYDVKKGEENILKLLKNDEIKHVETIHINKNKVRIQVIANASIINFDGARAILSINRDITELKNNSALLIENTEILKAAFEQAAVGIFQTDIQGNIVKVNKKFADMLHYSVDELLSMNYATITYPEDYHFQMEKDWNLISNILASYSIMKRFITKQGKIIWVLNSTTAIRAESGAPKYFFTIIEDISERKQAEENLSFYAKELQNVNQVLEKKTLELTKTIEDLEIAKISAEEASKIKSQFVANISHEIRTPLNVIINSAELLAHQIEDKFLQEYIEGIQLSGNSLLTLINDILDLSKIESGKFSLNTTQANLKDLVVSVEKIFKISCDIKGITINSIIDLEHSEIVILDEVRINQALFNLVGNSVKFTSKGAIKIIVKDSNYNEAKQTVSLQFTVIDTGCGIEDSKMSYLFSDDEKQTQINNYYFYGEGLGLPITKRIIEMMKGKMSVVSKVGDGTTVSIVLNDVPITLVNQENLDEDVSLNLSYVKKLNFLIIDEDLIGNLELKKIIDSRQLYFVSNSDDAIKVLLNEKIDVVFIELFQFSESAFSIINKLKQYTSSPILALINTDTPEVITKIISGGFNAWIKKPLNVKKIVNILRALNFDFRETVNNRLGSNVLKNIDYRRLKEILEGDIFEEWKTLIKSPYINKIKLFAAKLKKINMDFQVGKLEVFADELLDLSKSYNLTGLQLNLEKFPIILEEIANIK